MAAYQMASQLSVHPTETFIGNNIEGIAFYDGGKIREGMARLVGAYNNRVDSAEVDKPLMIEGQSGR